MNTLQQCEEWFRSRGFEARIIPSVALIAQYQGYKVAIPDTGNDTDFFKVDICFVSKIFEGFKRSELLEATSKICEQLKAVKAYLDEDGNVNFSVEILLDKTPQVKDVLPRVLDILTYAAETFIVILKK